VADLGCPQACKTAGAESRLDVAGGEGSGEVDDLGDGQLRVDALEFDAFASRATRLGPFREDVYYRLRIIPIEVPPLRVREEDMKPHPATGAVLSYPGNVRELEPGMGNFLRCMERGLQFYGGATFTDIFDNMKTVALSPKPGVTIFNTASSDKSMGPSSGHRR
jgi:hypothetical protein